jgi:RimJ/RimL family protein N-acetyltransferase
LRPEFCSGVTAPRIAPPVARNILITFGGSDPRNVTAKVLRILAEKPRLPLHFKVIAGAANPHLPELRTLAAAAPELMELLPNAANMAELMRWADLAVTAGGSTCLEGLATGLPMLVLVTAGNQQRVAEHLGRSGLAVNLGWYDACEPDFLCDRFLSLCRNQPQRALLGANGPATVDGHGVGRTVRHLLETPVWLRHVHASDARLLWTWANDPPVRAASFHPAPIPWEEHLAWLDRRLGDPRTLFLLALSGEDRPVGQVRFDFSDRESVLSVSIARDFRGCGLGVPVLQAACRRVFSGNPAVQVVRALIRPENTTSLHTFAKAGFVPDGDTCVNGIKARTFLLRRKEYP